MGTRINAISTTATSPAADDFLPLDGATNGSRKISANRMVPGLVRKTAISAFDDFFMAGNQATFNVSSVPLVFGDFQWKATGGTETLTQNNVAGRYGVARIGSNGNGHMHTATGFRSGLGVLYFETSLMFETLSDGSVQQIHTAGFSDRANATTSKFDNGIYFRYTHSENSGKWQAITKNGATETMTDTAITAAANTWYKLSIEVNAGGTSATFYIDDASVATIATNLPATTVALCAHLMGYNISGGGLRYFNWDWVFAHLALTTAR